MRGNWIRLLMPLLFVAGLGACASNGVQPGIVYSSNAPSGSYGGSYGGPPPGAYGGGPYGSGPYNSGGPVGAQRVSSSYPNQGGYPQGSYPNQGAYPNQGQYQGQYP